MIRVAALTVMPEGVRSKDVLWAWKDVEAVSHRSLWVSGKVTFQLSGGQVITAWGSPSGARYLAEAANAGREAWAASAGSEIKAMLGRCDEFLHADRYLSRDRVDDFVRGETAAWVQHRSAISILSSRGHPDALGLLRFIENPRSAVDRWNLRWSQEEQERWSELFDTVESQPLTNEQRKAVVDFENRNLLVAAAGSGKSSTLVAKIAYAVRKGLFRPDEILALAFNKAAAQELSERIATRLKDTPSVESIRSETFHALGYRILKEHEQRKQTIDNEHKKRIEEAYDHLKETVPEFRKQAVLFVLQYTPDIRARTEFSTYEEYLEYLKTEEQSGRDKGRSVPTLSGHHVASKEEGKILDWLFLHGVPFEYEKPYPLTQATSERRAYLPDLYYPDIQVWHEHFGVNDKGQPPDFMDAKEYLSGMQWKREIHLTNGTRLIETTSAMFTNGTLFDELEKQLIANGQRIRELSIAEIDAKLAQVQHRDLTELIGGFISHWKPRQIPFETLMAQGSSRDRAFLPLCKQVFDEYHARLKRDRRIDFDDLILGATQAVRSGVWQSPFRFILVDEFQDISWARAELVRALLAQKPDAVLFCVGDDWQAINGFAGSELTIMRQFEREFGFSVTNQLTRTFRSNQGISSIAKRFVERNPAQIKKEVLAEDRTQDDCVRIVRYRSRTELLKRYEEIAQELAAIGECSVRILGRYRKNRNEAYVNAFRRFAPAARVEADTIHKSKGLGADFVILDSVEGRGAFAFPSANTDDSVLRLVMPEKETFPYAEERRLMYVALTRAKRRVFVLTLAGRESMFVREIDPHAVAPSEATELACPYCKNGKRVRRKGQHGVFWGCSRYPTCDGKPLARTLVSRRRSG